MRKNVKKTILITSIIIMVIAILAVAAYIMNRFLNKNMPPDHEIAKQDLGMAEEVAQTTEPGRDIEYESSDLTNSSLAAVESTHPADSDVAELPAVNQAPVITRIRINDDEHETSIRNIQCIGRIPSFILINAFDAEDESLTYSVDISGGIILSFETFETGAMLVWGSEDIGNYQIVFQITDTSGNETVKIFDVSIEEIALEFVTGADPALCGHIVKDTMVYRDAQILVGDDGSGRQVKGYISFDIRDLTSSGAEILSAGIHSGRNTISGDLNFANELIIKSFDYGNSLDLGDFAVGGNFLTSFPVEWADQITFAVPELCEAVNEFIRMGKSHFQIKLGFDIPADADGTIDGIWIDRNTLQFRCQYRIP